MGIFFCKSVIAINFLRDEGNNSNGSTGPLMARLTPQRKLECTLCVFFFFSTPTFC